MVTNVKTEEVDGPLFIFEDDEHDEMVPGMVKREIPPQSGLYAHSSDDALIDHRPRLHLGGATITHGIKQQAYQERQMTRSTSSASFFSSIYNDPRVPLRTRDYIDSPISPTSSQHKFAHLNQWIKEHGFEMTLNQKGRLVFTTSDGDPLEVPSALEDPDTPDGFLPPSSSIPPPPLPGQKNPFNHLFRVAKNDPEHHRWRVILGDWLARSILQLPDIPPSAVVKIADFPQHYELGCHWHYGKLREPGPGGVEYAIRKDLYLYGSRSGRSAGSGRQVVFRSPEEFKPHALWLIDPRIGECQCKYCNDGGYKQYLADKKNGVFGQANHARTFGEYFNKTS